MMFTRGGFVNLFGYLARPFRFAELDDQVEACRRIFESRTRWAVVRGSDLEEGGSQVCLSGAGTWGIPYWQASSREALILRYSWLKLLRTINSFTKLRQLQGARVPRHLRTLQPSGNPECMPWPGAAVGCPGSG